MASTDAQPAGRAPLGPAPQIDLAAAFQQAPTGMVILDRDLRYVACNDAMADINGYPPGAHIGRTVREMLPDLAAQLEDRFRSAFETGVGARDLVVIGTTPKTPDVTRAWLESITPLTGRDGQVEHLLVSVHEITSQYAAEAALRESETKFRASQQLRSDSFAILRAARDPAGEVVDFEWEYANPAAEAALGRGPLTGRRLGDLIPGAREHPAFVPRFKRLLSQANADEVEFETVFGGVRRSYRSCAAALDEDRIAVALQDLSGHLQKEEQLRLVTAEFRHRVKNVIAITLGLISQTERSTSDVRRFSRTLRERLHALAAAQDLLLAGGEAVTLEDAVRTALRPFASARVEIDGGPSVELPAFSVTPVVLSLNELATNALKHGALSTPGGRIRLRWRQSAGRVVFTWTETGGPPVRAGDPAGLGSRILAAAAATLPNGVLKREFAPAGLHAEIAFDCGAEPSAGVPGEQVPPR